MTDLKERCLLYNRAKTIKCLIWSYHWRKLLKVLHNTCTLLVYKYLQKMQIYYNRPLKGERAKVNFALE